MSCPNKNSQEFIELVNALGEDNALKIFIVYEKKGEELPNVEKARQLIDFYNSVEDKKEELQVDDEITKIGKELENSPKHKELIEISDRYYDLVSRQIKKIINSKDFERLKTLFKDKNSSIRPVSLQNLLSKANKMLEDVEGIARRTRAIATGVVQTDFLLDKMKDDVKEILKDEKNAIRNIATLQSYLITAKEWGLFLDDTRKTFQEGNPSFTKLISSAQGKISDIETYILQNDKSGLVQALKPILTEGGQKFIEHLNEEIASQNKILKKAKNKEDVEQVKSNIIAAEKLKQRLDFNNNREILDTLEGKNVDTNSLSILIESFRDNPNFVISSFATFIRNNFDDVDIETHPILKSYENEVAFLVKILGGRFNVSTIGNALSVEDERVDKDGTEYKTLMLLNPYKGIYKAKQFLYNTLNNLKQELKTKRGTHEEQELRESIRQAKRELTQHQADYWYRPLKDEFYQKDELFQDDIGRALKEDADDIIGDILHIQDVALAIGKELTQDELDNIEVLWREYTQLGNVNNLDGTSKTGIELDKALRMQQIRELNRELFEWIPNTAKFIRDRQAYSEQLIAKNDPNYKNKLANWDLENIITKIKQEYYDRREQIFEDIADLLENIKGEDNENIEELWKEITGLTYGFRDEDGQPIGISISEGSTERIKLAQKQIEELKNRVQGASGLSRQESARLNELYEKAYAHDISQSEQDELNELKNKSATEGLTKDENDRLKQLWAELGELSSKVPTSYYIDAFNALSQKYGITIDEIGNINGISALDNLQGLLEHKDFKDWFELNHLQAERFNFDTKEIENKWERLYHWSRIIPKDNSYFETTKLEDGTVIDGIPARKYSYRKVKDEYKTEPIEGENTDNKGNWLPKTKGAKDGRYINPEYERMKNSTNEKDKALFKLLQIHTKYHLLAQEGLNDNKKLWLDLPALRKTSMERNIEMLSKPNEIPTNLKKRLKSWIDSQTEYSSGKGNYGEETGQESPDKTLIEKGIDAVKNVLHLKKETQKDIIQYGTDANMLPIKYTGKLEAEDNSRNLFRSISKYLYSAKTNLKLQEMSPISNALERVLANTDVERKKRNPEAAETNVSKAVRFIINKEFKGRDKAHELGVVGELLAQISSKAAYTAFIPFNLPSSANNVVQGVTQNIIDSGNGRYSKLDYASSFGIYTTRFTPAWQSDYWKNELGKQSLEGQMIDLWEPIQSHEYESGVGEKFASNKWKDLVAFKWMLHHREWGEFHIQSRIWITYMNTIKIKQKIGKEIKNISLLDAYELNDEGIIKLKKAIDKSWDFDGDKYKEAKREIQQINRRIQGSFSKMDSSMASQYTLYNLALFLNRWFLAPAINRWAADDIKINNGVTLPMKLTRAIVGTTVGVSVAALLSPLSPLIAIPTGIKIGTLIGAKIKSVPRFNINSGYQWGWNMAALNAVAKLQENKTLKWDILTNEERRGLRRQYTQFGVILLAELILKGLQLGAGDDDKKKKAILASMSVAEKNLVYLIMRNESETNQFDSPAQYFHFFDNMPFFTGMKKWEDLAKSAIHDIGTSIEGQGIAEYQKSEGSIEKGTSKTYVKLLKATGLQGFSNAFDDDDLTNFVSTYDSNIRSKQ